MPRCPYCSFENAPGATFCANCGRALERAAPSLDGSPSLEGERRFVTILFADISGFTALSETADPEEIRTLINACFDELVPIVLAHNGAVDQFIGDALLALFGAPLAHEDDPEQACRAALAMLRAMDGFNAAHGTDLGLHVGINSGNVLAGGLGAQSQQHYTVVGDAVNVAARLYDAAERGEIFVGAETYRLTRGLFEYHPHSTMVFKGKRAPVPVYLLTSEKAGAPRRRGAGEQVTPMVGRERELAALKRVTREMAAESAAPELRAVLVLGEAGIGKSRLVREWFEFLAKEHPAIRRVQAQCVAQASESAFYLLGELVRALAEVPRGAAAPETRAALDRLLDEHLPDPRGEQAPYLAQLLALPLDPAESARVGTLDAAGVQARYRQLMERLLKGAAVSAPLIVVIEDLHWADAPSTAILTRLLSLLAGTPILFCLVLRPETDAPGWRLVDAVEELPGVGALRLNLAPLTATDSGKILNYLSGQASFPDSARDLILATAEGNPFFVEELARMLIERGDLVQRNGEWTLTRTLESLDVPNTLQGVLMARIDQLPERARRILQIASVIGREFPVEILEELVQAGEVGP